MARFFGKVGYADTVEKTDGVWVEVITERPYYGDVLKNNRKMDTADQVLSNISVGNRISIVADAYAHQHFFAIRYVEWAGARWIVSDVEVDRPRLTLRLGGVYNGPTAPTSGTP